MAAMTQHASTDTSAEPTVQTFDLIVIGGGRAGALAMAAANAGQRVALIERDKLGGTCPNRGCIPSKMLIGFAETGWHVQHAAQHFIDAEFNGANLDEIFDSVNTSVAAVDPGTEKRVEASGAHLFRGEARFVDTKTLQVNGLQLTADKIVIGTGSSPSLRAMKTCRSGPATTCSRWAARHPRA